MTRQINPVVWRRMGLAVVVAISAGCASQENGKPAPDADISAAEPVQPAQPAATPTPTEPAPDDTGQSRYAHRAEPFSPAAVDRLESNLKPLESVPVERGGGR